MYAILIFCISFIIVLTKIYIAIAFVAIPYRAGSISAFNIKFLLTTNKEKVKAAGVGELTALPQTPYLGAGGDAPYCTHPQSL